VDIAGVASSILATPTIFPLHLRAAASGCAFRWMPAPQQQCGDKWRAFRSAFACCGDADMGKFMIAHLNHGGALLNPQTAALMHGYSPNAYSRLPGMALGFYHEDRNGLQIVGHGGDTVFFHSDLHLFLDKNVGLYVSMNSPGKATAVHPLREQLFEQFTDRYFPANTPYLPTAATARQHGAVMAGHYVSSRASGFSFLRLAALAGQTKVTVDQDGILSASTITDASGDPRHWREVGPWLWQEVGGNDYLQAIPAAGGKIRMFSITPYGAIIEFLPAPAALDAGWILPLAGLAFLVLLVAALGWPLNALIRRRYKQPALRDGQALRLHRVSRITAWLFLAVAAGWLVMLSLVDKDLDVLNGGLDLPMRLLQIVLLLAIIGSLATAWNAWKVASAKGSRWWSIVWAVIIALSALFLAWLCVDVGLLTLSLDF
ncbi:MAG: hypothetical protein ABI626_00150, partial [Sphingomicrobium sp.]